MLALIVQLYVFVFDVDQDSHIQVVGLQHQNVTKHSSDKSHFVYEE